MSQQRKIYAGLSFTICEQTAAKPSARFMHALPTLPQARQGERRETRVYVPVMPPSGTRETCR